MTITLPDELRDELERKAKAAGFDTVADYFCWLVREDGEALSAQDLGYASDAELEAILVASLNSGPPVLVTPEFWEERRRVLEERIAWRQESGDADAPHIVEPS